MMKSKVTVFLDLDGVIVDWYNGLREFAGKPPEIYDIFRDDPMLLSFEAITNIYGGHEDLTKLQASQSSSFWVDLKTHPWSDYLIQSLQKKFSVAFLTSPGNFPISAQGKMEWQKIRYPDIPILITKHKYMASAPNKILIDDDDWQLTRFDQAGGMAIKWPNQFELEKVCNDDTITKLIDIVIKTIEQYQQALT